LLIVALVSVLVTGVTVVVNWSMNQQRLKHERIQAARGTAAATFARAWRHAESLNRTNAEKLVTELQTPDEINRWLDATRPEADEIRFELLTLSALGWNARVQTTATDTADQMALQRASFFATVTSPDAATRELGYSRIDEVNGKSTDLLKELREAINE